MAAPYENMRHFIIFGVFLFTIPSITCFDDEFEGSRTLTLEHSFDQGIDPIFFKRGTVVIRSAQSNRATFSQYTDLSPEDRKTLEQIAAEDGIYRIRIPVKETDEGTLYVSTFSKACLLYESSLTDNILLSVDQSGEVLGVSMSTIGNCMGLDVPASNLSDWNTQVDISVTVTGPVPDTQSYIDKIKKEEQQKAKGAQAENKSFLGKYWMYIVPFVIMMFIMQSMDPNQGQGGGGGGGR